METESPTTLTEQTTRRGRIFDFSGLERNVLAASAAVSRLRLSVKRRLRPNRRKPARRKRKKYF